MESLPAVIIDEKGGWPTAPWYPHAPPIYQQATEKLTQVDERGLASVNHALCTSVYHIKACYIRNAMKTYVPSVPAPLAGPYQVAPASDQPAQGRKARAVMAMKQDKTATPICLEAMPEAGLRYTSEGAS
jgi:hypothetical protein